MTTDLTPETATLNEDALGALVGAMTEVITESLREDGILNGYSGVGSVLDRSEANTQQAVRKMTETDLQRAYLRGRFGRVLVERLPNDAMRRGFKVLTKDGGEIEPYKDDLDRLKAKQRLHQAHVTARYSGGCGVVMMVDDGLPLDQPLDLTKARALTAIHPMSRFELTPMAWNAEFGDVDWDEPTMYSITPNREAQAKLSANGDNKGGPVTEIHGSRVIPYFGLYTPPELRQYYDGWGQPVLEAVRDARDGVELAAQSIETVLHEWKYDVYSFEDLEGLLSGPVGETGTQSNKRFLVKMEAIRFAKSMINGIVIDASKEKFETRTVEFRGVVDAFSVLAQMLSASSGHPLTLLFGQAPKGFATEDKSGRENWQDNVESARSEKHTPAIRRIVDVLQAIDRNEVPYEVQWPSQEQLSTKEKAEARKTTLEGDEIAVRIGALDPDDVHKRHESPEFQFDLAVEPQEGLESFEEMDDEASRVRADAHGNRVDVFGGPNDPKLPTRIRRLSEKKRRQWIAVWNQTFNSTGDEGRAFAAANSVVSTEED